MNCYLMHIYYGDGKGKTTAAIGLAYRCANRGKRVLFSAFLKGRDSGEFLGKAPFVVDNFNFCKKFWFELSEEEKRCAKDNTKKQLESLMEKSANYDMIILDEFLDAVSVGCIEKEYALDFIKSIYGKVEIVLTGHERVDEIFSLADYITEMKNEKHPFDRGIKGRCGIEF